MASKSIKKKIIIPVSILAAVVILLGIIILPAMLMTTVDNSLSLMSHTDKAPMMVAHRGLSSLAPENSLPAFELAEEYGFDGYEFDVHTTKDGQWVVIHDDTVDKMTDGSGNVEDFTLSEIRKLRLDAGNSAEEYKNLYVPTLKEAIEINCRKDIIPVIEIKKCDVQYLPKLKSMLDYYSLGEKAVIISFEKEYLEQYRALDKDIQMLYLSSEPTVEDIEWCAENNAGINFYFGNLYKCTKAVSLAKEKGMTIGAWTVDNTAFEDVLVLAGVDIITTNKLLP